MVCEKREREREREEGERRGARDAAESAVRHRYAFIVTTSSSIPLASGYERLVMTLSPLSSIIISVRGSARRPTTAILQVQVIREHEAALTNCSGESQEKHSSHLRQRQYWT